MWQEGCRSVKLNIKAALFSLTFLIFSAKYSLFSQHIFFFYVWLKAQQHDGNRNFALVSSVSFIFFAVREREGAISTLSHDFSCVLNAENKMTRGEKECTRWDGRAANCYERIGICRCKENDL